MPSKTIGLLVAAFIVGCLAPKDAMAKETYDSIVSRYVPFGFQGTVLVAKKGKAVFHQGYGLADVEKKRKNGPRTLFEIASLTKQFTAAAILHLDQRGKLDVEDSIAKHLPFVPAHSRPITIHHLLTHTSGVPRTNDKGFGPDLERATLAFLDDGPKQPQGKSWGYWNGGYAILAGIVEQVSDMPFVDYCRKHLFEPARMKDSGFTGSSHLDRKRAAFSEGRSALDHPYGTYDWRYRGMGGIVTTTGDLLLWHRALQGDRVLGKEARDKFFEPHVIKMAHGSDYGYGWYVGRAPDGSEMARHGGDVRGFHCRMRRYPRTDACVIVLANSPGEPLRQIADNLEDLLFKQNPRHELPPEPISVKARNLPPFGGTFQNAKGQKVTITTTKRGLRVQADSALAATLTGDPKAKQASFDILPLDEKTFVAWSFRRSLTFQFQGKGRKIGGFEVAGQKFRRE